MMRRPRMRSFFSIGIVLFLIWFISETRAESADVKFPPVSDSEPVDCYPLLSSSSNRTACYYPVS
jgi:hypothetical protein